MSIDEIVQALMGRGWKPSIPASTIQLLNVESRYDVHLPHDYREFFGISNGSRYRGLMSLDEVQRFNETYKVVTNFPGLLAIANEGFLVYAFDFRGEEPVIVSIGLSSSLWEDVFVEAKSFSEWLEDGLISLK